MSSNNKLYQRKWRKKNINKVRDYSKKYMKKWRKRQEKLRLCKGCNNKLDINEGKYCFICLSKERKRNKKVRLKFKERERLRAWRKNWNYKIEALKIISNGKVECVKCGIKDIRILTINHKNNKGDNEKRRGINITQNINIVKGRRGVKDLEVRCFNCNILYEYERGRLKSPFIVQK